MPATQAAMAATVAPPPPSAEGGGPFAEGDIAATGQDDRPEARLRWVFLDAWKGRLHCPILGMEAACLTGRITESRLVRAFGGGHGGHGEDGHEEEDGALCASENRRVADHGRPGRECAGCEERHALCTPRWRIVWEGVGEEEPGSGPAFAHTLSAAGTVQFTRYALALRREGLRPQEVLTRICGEELRYPATGKVRWRLRFEKAGTAG